MTPPITNELEDRLREAFVGAKVVTDRWIKDDDEGAFDNRESDLVARIEAASLAQRTRRFAAPASAAAAVLVLAGSAAAFSAFSDNGSAHTGAATRGSPSGRLPNPATTPAPTHVSAAGPTARYVAEPAWVKKCIRSSDRPAAAYIGLTLSAARAVALQRGETLVGYGLNGSCQGHLAVRVPKPVAIAVTGANSDESNPRHALVVYAAHVDPISGN